MCVCVCVCACNLYLIKISHNEIVHTPLTN